MSLICRLCLNANASNYESLAAVEEKYFKLVLPEINMQLVPSPVFCQSCVDLLQTTYSFKSNCIETEKMLKLYAANYNESQLLLNKVLQDDFWSKIQTRFGNNDPRELLNKDVKVECDNDMNYGCDFDMSEDDNELNDDTKFGKKPLICQICETKFDDRDKLVNHLKMHFETFVCKVCGDLYSKGCEHLAGLNFTDDNVRNCQEVVVKLEESRFNKAVRKHFLVDSEESSYSDSEIDDLNRPFKCDSCDKTYTQHKHLLDHVKTHFEKPKCLKCDKRFYNMSAMKRHLARVHKVDINIGNDEDTAENWRDVINFEVNEDKMDQTLKKLIDEKPDFKEIDSGRPFKCDMCNKSYNVKSCLLNHIKTHLRRPVCKLCSKSYYNMHCLKRHMLQMHNVEIGTKIDEFDENFEIADEATTEQHKHNCETCGKHFSLKSSYDRHKLTHTGQKSFICDFCQKGFLTKTYLERHISVCHLGIRPKKNLERNFTCHTCGLTTNNKHTLIQHIRIHTGERPYKCDICDKAFAQSSSLGTHKRTVHSTERLFTCEYCSKSFNAKGSLTKHILEVHLVDKIEKKFVCNYCGKKYRLQSQLNSHLKWHLADRQFSCDICGKPFVDKHSVKKHRVTHFAEKQHKCEICGKGFHQKYNIKIHMKVHSRLP